jgi:hypothetical protein
VIAGFDFEFEIVVLRFAFDRVNVENFDGFAVETKFELRSFRAGLLAECAGANDVFAGGVDMIRRVNLAFLIQRKGVVAVRLAAIGGGRKFFRFDALLRSVKNWATAAERYFSRRMGGIERTSPMLSNP